jgi:TPP-dependent 2-oxoacid decarboxylase
MVHGQGFTGSDEKLFWLAVTVIVLDNKGYGTERLLHEGSFNDINPWRYELIPQVLGGGTGYEVRTEGEFDAALTKALADTSAMSLIRVHIALDDRSLTLDRLAAGLARRPRPPRPRRVGAGCLRRLGGARTTCGPVTP